MCSTFLSTNMMSQKFNSNRDKTKLFPKDKTDYAKLHKEFSLPIVVLHIWPL